MTFPRPASAPTRGPVRVNIERLVLDGLPFSRTEAGRLQTALETELARLFSASAASPDALRASAVPAVSAAPIFHVATDAPDALARQAARSLFAALGPGAGRSSANPET